MHKLRLTRPNGEQSVVDANKYVRNFLWANFYDLGFNEIEDLTNMGLA